MKRKMLIVAAVIISSQLCAQQDSTGKLLDEVTLTSNKYPKKQSETGKVITIINRAQLEKNSGKSVGEVLNTVAGTNILGVNNNLGTNHTASIRGASAGNTLILIDGIPLMDPSVNNNYFDLNFFSIDQVERIEILKGGQSTLYGTDAVLGVINIILKKPTGKKASVTGSLTAGSYSTYKQNAGLSGTVNRFSYSTGYTHLSSEGFSSAYDANKTGTFDKDGFDQHVINSRFGYALSQKVSINAHGTYSYYKTDLDASAFIDEKDYTVKNDNGQAGAGLEWRHARGMLRVNYNFNYVERDYLDDSTYKSSPYSDYSKAKYIGRTHFAEAYNNWKWQNWELLAGIDYRLNNTDQYYFSTGSFGPSISLLTAKMNQLSAYGSLIYKNEGGMTTEIGGRWSHHSEYGDNFSFTLNPSVLISRRLKLFVNLYSAFKTPTLYQLFDPSAGNADLKPEKGVITEAGFEYSANQSFRFRTVGFYRHTKDAIVYSFNPQNFVSKYINASKQDNYGLETELTYLIGKLSITANYTYTDGKTKARYDGTGAPISKDTSYYNLYRIPKHVFNLSLGMQFTKSLYISTQLHTVGKREEFIYGGAPEELKSYATLDLYGEYRFDKRIKVFLDLKNITDKEYFDLRGYNARKFNFTGGVLYNF